ncbi:MAG: ornithine carbamoyltransferase [Rhizobiaceae bacterium]
MARHFLDIAAVPAEELRSILKSSSSMKGELKAGNAPGTGLRPYEGKVLAMIFDKPSTRTRVSFDVGMRQLGGETIILDGESSQMGRGETVADTARVLSRYVDAIMIRTTAHERLLELAEHATVPVINGLTDETHPCQIMADIMTFEEHKGAIEGKTIAYSGDGNNVVNSMMEATSPFGFNLNIASPEGYEPDPGYLSRARNQGGNIQLTRNPREAVTGVDCVVTDTWSSMGMEENSGGHNTFAPYQVNEALMQHADPGAIFMHCLPAHRGEEVTDEVMDGAQSVIFDEAENRLHVQKGILAWCLSGK